MGIPVWQSTLGKSVNTGLGVASVFSVGDRPLVRVTKADKLVSCDASKMIATAVLATATVDAQGDIVNPFGADVIEHKSNPLVLFDHGKDYSLPIAKSRNAHGEYSVRVDGDRLLGDAQFSSKDQVSNQLFRLVEDDLIRGWSVGFDPVEGGYQSIGRYTKSLGRSPMQFDRWRLVEYSLTPRGVNPEAITIMVEKSRVGGEPMHDFIRKSLSPFTIKPHPAFLSVPPGTSTAVVRKADMAQEQDMFGDADGMDAGEGTDAQPQVKPTVAALQDLAQGVMDVVYQARQTLGQGEHMKGRKIFDKIAMQLESLAAKAGEAGDKINDELQDMTGGEGDVEVDGPEEVEANDDGSIVTKSQYKARRWVPSDAPTVYKSAFPALDDPDDDDDDDTALAELEAKMARLQEQIKHAGQHF